ncbi:EamA family transporter RarD [Roseibium sp.]|uniref:EamA family transporter RarD n=1 Tax=Roseibium sp. TaxID=1936156 RepID=UPI003A9774A7
MTQAAPAGTAPDETRTGILFALGAYGLWGILPGYFKLIDAVAPETVVAQRIVWSVLFVGLFLMLMRRTREIGEIAREPRLVGLLCISAGLIAVNWLVFVWAVEHEKVLDVSLGYFINPLVSILVGLVVLREKLSPLQGVAVGLAAAGVALQAVLLGGLPWVSLLLAFSFAGYGYFRKITPVRATPGLWMETVLLLPLAGGYLLLQGMSGVDVLRLGTPSVFVALAGLGIVTALPLILFSAAARRLPMVLIGLMQYIAPSLHFVTAVFIWHEPLHPATLTTFGFIWLALGVFSFDSWRRWKANARKNAAIAG